MLQRVSKSMQNFQANKLTAHSHRTRTWQDGNHCCCSILHLHFFLFFLVEWDDILAAIPNFRPYGVGSTTVVVLVSVSSGSKGSRFQLGSNKRTETKYIRNRSSNAWWCFSQQLEPYPESRWYLHLVGSYHLSKGWNWSPFDWQDLTRPDTHRVSRSCSWGDPCSNEMQSVQWIWDILANLIKKLRTKILAK